MPMHPARRYIVTAVITCLALVLLLTYAHHSPDVVRGRLQQAAALGGKLSSSFSSPPSETVQKGHAIAPKLGNETAKAELGRATWKYFHTVMARFPDEPTKDESLALDSYIHLFQRLYPCGECAEHFGQILAKFPPQTSSRSAAAAWACHVHNEVNKSLKKEIFDCSNIGDFYNCGCADGGEGEGEGESSAKAKEENAGATKRGLDTRLGTILVEE